MINRSDHDDDDDDGDVDDTMAMLNEGVNQCVSHWLCDGDADDGGGYVNDDYGDHGDDDDDDANDDGDDDDDDQK